MSLATNYKDDILATSMSGKRRYNLVDENGNIVTANVHIEDVSQYTQIGDNYGADEINEQNEAINNHTNIIGDTDISDIGDGTATGAISELNSIVSKSNRHTGTYLAEVGTKEGSALAHTIYGMSVQDGTPTPDSPVEIQSAKADFRCTGKNLIPYPYYHTSRTENGITFTVNGDGNVTANGTATANTRFYFTHTNFPFNVNPKFAYIFSVEFSYSTTNLNVKAELACYNGTTFIGGSGIWRIIDETGSVVINSLSTLTYDRLSIYVNIPSGVTVNNLTFKPMLTLADVDQTYEVNQHTDVTTNLTLRSIEVASTDNYNLVKDGKYYIADTVDWSEDRGYEITRRIKEITINSGDVTAPSNPRYGTVLRTAFNPNEFSVRQAVKNNLLLSSFVSSTYENFVGKSGNGLAFFDGTNLRLRHDSMTSTADWSTYLQSNPVKVIGVLITPTTESITSEQAQALLSLKTYDEATSITATSDIEPTINLEYATSEISAKALTGHNLAYKNALKLNDINTALIELGGN